MFFPTTKRALILILSILFFTPVFAVISTNKTMSLISLNKPSISKPASFFQKKELKIQKFLNKKGINLTHPTDKWLWFGLGLLAFAIVLSFMPIVKHLASLVSLVGIVFIFIWLFKKLV